MSDTIIISTPAEQMALRYLEQNPGVAIAVAGAFGLFFLLVLGFVVWTFVGVIRGHREFDKQWKRGSR